MAGDVPRWGDGGAGGWRPGQEIAVPAGLWPVVVVVAVVDEAAGEPPELSRLWDGVATAGLCRRLEDYLEDDDVIRWWEGWREATGIEPG